MNRRVLEMSGVKLTRAPPTELGAIKAMLMPAVLIKPSFAVTLAETKAKF